MELTHFKRGEAECIEFKPQLYYAMLSIKLNSHDNNIEFLL